MMDLNNTINQSIRLIATLGIWGFMALILTLNDNNGSMSWLALSVILGIGATISTWRIWETPKQSVEEITTKAKRTNRVSKIVKNLNDDEVAELADLLIAREESRSVDGDRRSHRLSE